MPKVLILTTSLGVGGPTGVVTDQVRALTNRGVECSVWGLDRPAPGYEFDLDVPVRSLGLPGWAANRVTTHRLTQALAAERPDVLHLHSFSPHVHGTLAARAVGLPQVIVSFHDFRLGLRRALQCRLLAGGVDRVIVLNEAMRELYARQCGYPAEKLTILPNAVDTRRFAPAPRDEALTARYGLGSDQYVIGTVGGLNRVKGHRFLVEAFAEVLRDRPEARLVLVGEGPEHERLQRLAERLNVVDRVIFAGRQANIQAWLSLFDLYVQPSRVEADPLAVKEALAMARPVVGTSAGGMPELLAGGRAGVLVPPRRPRELAAAILALAADPARAQALGEAGRAYMVHRYDFRDYEQHLWDLYAPLLGAPAEEPQPALANRVLAYK